MQQILKELLFFLGHTRTHLGLSPYKCSLCSYSSADKSTLIRHFRTHNGERPFQCRVCDFAFTTKANCERHVRYGNISLPIVRSFFFHFLLQIAIYNYNFNLQYF